MVRNQCDVMAGASNTARAPYQPAVVVLKGQRRMSTTAQSGISAPLLLWTSAVHMAKRKDWKILHSCSLKITHPSEVPGEYKRVLTEVRVSSRPSPVLTCYLLCLPTDGQLLKEAHLPPNPDYWACSSPCQLTEASGTTSGGTEGHFTDVSPSPPSMKLQLHLTASSLPHLLVSGCLPGPALSSQMSMRWNLCKLG